MLHILNTGLGGKCGAQRACLGRDERAFWKKEKQEGVLGRGSRACEASKVGSEGHLVVCP